MSNTATPEQLNIFRHRRNMALLIELVAIILAPIVAMTLFALNENRGNLAKAFAMVSLICVFVGGQIARHWYFRCPVCAKPLTRGPKHVQPKDFFKSHCNNCDTDFFA